MSNSKDNMRRRRELMEKVLPGLLDKLLVCPIPEQEVILSEFRSCGLVEGAVLKSTVTPFEQEGEAIWYNKLILFIPDRARDGVFKVGESIIDFD